MPHRPVCVLSTEPAPPASIGRELFPLLPHPECLAAHLLPPPSARAGIFSYQEDTYLTTSLSLPLSALRINILDDRLGSHWAPLPQHLEGFEGEHGEDKEERRRQVACFGVFDGHGGSPTSQYLSHSLPSLIESARARDIPAEIDAYRAQGGYLRRYRGGVLERFRAEKVQEAKERGDFVRGMSAGEMAALGFLKADNHVLSTPSEFSRSGSVGTLALLHSLDLPHSHPFYSSSLLSLTLAHLGDTSALLLSSASGRAYRLTQAHHPDSRTEMERLRTTGTGVITDSFGESRWGGMLANTRGVGDREFKSLGVIAEPEVVKRVFKGPDFASLLLLSDGITDALSDQEIADLVRLEIYAARGRKELASPERAARRVVGLAEDVGAEDNLTCLVIPLPGWSKLQGLDTTLSRREYRVRQASTRGGSRQRG
ncbi:Protein phosphatase 2C 6 [Rhodosporidiobolus nylandii]